MVSIATTEERDLITTWFYLHTGEVLVESILSDYGYVYKHMNEPIAAIFIYPVLHSKVCFIGWPIANPKASKDARDVALNELIEKAEESARNMGYTWMNTYSSRSSVESRFKKHNYTEGDKNVTQLIKFIGGI